MIQRQLSEQSCFLSTSNMMNDASKSMTLSPSIPIDPSLQDGSIRVVSGSGFRYVTPFPWRLHEMLEEMERKGSDKVVSWLPSGKAFKVHDTQAFSKIIIPNWFKHKCYKSFQRQLHLYGFRRLNDGPEKGTKDGRFNHGLI